MTQAMSNANFDVVRLDGGVDAEAWPRGSAPNPMSTTRRRVTWPGRVTSRTTRSIPRQWNFPAIDMERAWDINTGGSSAITRGVLDTGVAFGAAHAALRTHRWHSRRTATHPVIRRSARGRAVAAAPELAGADRFVSPRDFIWDDDLPFDLDGHGTHVAGTIGQLTNNGVGVAGMAFNVRIMPVKVIDSIWDLVFNSPFVGTDDTVARGVRYAVDNGAKVINMSIGRSGPPAPVVEDAIRYAVSRGAFVAVAGGNEFCGTGRRAAGGVRAQRGRHGGGRRGRSRQAQRAVYSSVGSFIELMAPGGDFTRGGAHRRNPAADLRPRSGGDLHRQRQPVPRAALRLVRLLLLQGTSMATPHVAGFAALLMQQGITSPAAIEAIMKQFATDLGTAGRDDEYGYGLINPRAALRGLGLAK